MKYRTLLSSCLKVLLPFLLAVAILWWMYRGFEWDQVREVLASRRMWVWMLLSFPFGISAQVFRAMRWRQVLRPMGENPRLHTCVNAVFLSYASSLVVPRVGEVLRCGVLKRYDGTNFSRSVGTVVTERVVDIVLILLLSFLTMMTQIPVFLTFFQQTGVTLEGFLSSFSLTGYLVTGLCAVLLVAFGCVIVRHLGIFSKTKSMLLNLRDGLFSVSRVQNPVLFLLYSVAIWASYYLHFLLTFYCFQETASLGWVAALVAFVVGTFAVLVPTPNGAGPWHFAVKTVLVLYGIGQSTAAIFVLIVHTLQTLLVLLLGVYAVLTLSFTRRKIGTA